MADNNTPPTPTPPAKDDASTLYDDYETYNFEILTWEQLDRETFKITDSGGSKEQDLFDKYCNHKIKFFAYLNFFSSVPEISIILNAYKEPYSAALNYLITLPEDKDPLEKFQDDAAYEKLENNFIGSLSDNAREYYVFFKSKYDFFNKIGAGFFVNLGGQLLIEKETIKESGMTIKRIAPWNSPNNDYLEKVIRTYPLLYKSPKNNNAFCVQYVCFIDGCVRNSIDYFENEKMYRFYLPVTDAGNMTVENIKKTRKVNTFTARRDAYVDFLKNKQVSIYFDPDAAVFDSDLTLIAVSQSRNLRGCSIY